MSEFKFACPVCGQHITASSSASGEHLTCPTCFQRIVVPQAPADGDSRLILSAAQAGKSRPPLAEGSDLGPLRKSSRSSVPFALLMAALLCSVGAVLWLWGDKLIPRKQPQVLLEEPLPVTPTNTFWTLDLTNAVIPDVPALGSLRGERFLPEHATIYGGALTLREGTNWPPDSGITVFLPGWQGEQWSDKKIEIAPSIPSKVPTIAIWWKDGQQRAMTDQFTNGYALKLSFGPSANEHLPGHLYIALPDEQKSYVGGAFNARILRPKPRSGP